MLLVKKYKIYNEDNHYFNQKQLSNENIFFVIFINKNKNIYQLFGNKYKNNIHFSATAKYKQDLKTISKERYPSFESTFHYVSLLEKEYI